MPSVSLFTGSTPTAGASEANNGPNHNKGGQNSKLSTQPQSHAGEIAGGVIGGLVLLALLALGIFFFLRRRRNHTAPSAEFLTVYPPTAPFTRAGSFRSGMSLDPPASFTTEKYSSSYYPQPMMSYP